MPEPTFDPGEILMLETADALSLAELRLHQADVTAAIDAMEGYFALEPVAANNTVRGALFVASVIRFMCSFDKGGKDHKLVPVTTFASLQKWEEMYGWFHDTRDAFAAHSFGPLRQSQVIALVEPQAPLRIADVGITTFIYSGPEEASREHILTFMKTARDAIDQTVSQLLAQILDDARSYTSDQVASLRPHRVMTPETDEIRMSRARFRTKVPRILRLEPDPPTT